MVAGRDFNDLDRRGSEPVIIVSQSLARRMFPNQDAVNRHLTWTDPVMKFIGITPQPRRIVGVVADVDDENVVPGAAVTVYQAFGQELTWAACSFTCTAILTRWSHRFSASSAGCRRSSRWNAPRLLKIFGRKC
jgi:hypothetical protein